ncbi:hypothetical protein C4D60_Mb04t06440 [Musa balbisiana]|uniref:Secreted protein n=1 Tax=Musa balbisiana TaxID=52838 RepID=A0A4V6T4R0_MUSBA|nr:hypothetical protein C4D60_Mb04t06440 [Musa balbisiana]
MVHLGALHLLPLLLVGVLVAAQSLGVGELAAAVLALVLPHVSTACDAAGSRGGAVCCRHIPRSVRGVVAVGDVESEELKAWTAGGLCLTLDAGHLHNLSLIVCVLHSPYVLYHL